jgi:hypothetical protein
MENRLFDLRDFFYSWVKKNHGADYALSEHRFRLSVLLSILYFDILFIFALFVIYFLPNKSLNSNQIIFLKNNLSIKLVGIIVIFLPYYFWVKMFLFPKLNSREINEFNPNNKKMAFFSIGVLMLGLIVMLIAGALNNYLRFGHF